MENITKSAQEAATRIPQITQNAADSLGKAIQNLAENLVPVMDRLAGTQSTLKLSFRRPHIRHGNGQGKDYWINQPRSNLCRTTPNRHPTPNQRYHAG